jgi:hypothetical protein
MVNIINIKENLHKHVKDEVTSTVRGQVEIYEKFPDGNLKLHDKSNLVVYQGRNWLMQRALNEITIPESVSNIKNAFISWFGCGSGGASSNLMVPLAPSLSDADLTQQSTINNKVSTDCIDDGKYHPFDSVEFVIDSDNNNELLKASITVTLGADDGNGPAGGTTVSDFYDLNEAGLYVSDSKLQADFTGGSAAAHLATIRMFARVTFSTLRKFPERQIVFVWNVFF